jgi:hypothetical protein
MSMPNCLDCDWFDEQLAAAIRSTERKRTRGDLYTLTAIKAAKAARDRHRRIHKETALVPAA